MTDMRAISYASDPPFDVLDTVVNNNDYKTLNVFVDFKNCSTALFISDVIADIVNNSSGGNKMDSSIFQSLIYTIYVWKKYAKQKNIKCNIFITNDYGRSTYHRSINDKYKLNRDITFSTMHEQLEEIYEIRDRNLDLAESIINKIPDCYLFNLNHLESDFLSHFIISRVFKSDPSYLNIICSNDKDMYQSLNLDNVIIYNKKKGNKTILTKHNVLRHFFEIDKSGTKQLQELDMLKNVDLKYFSTMLCIMGDTSDNIAGIKGLGKKTLLKMFSNTKIIKLLFEDIDKLKSRVNNNQTFLVEGNVGISELKSINPFWETIILNNNMIKNNFKLVDFEMLCEWIEKKDTTTKVDYFNYIYNRINKTNITLIENYKDLFDTLKNKLADLQLEEIHIKELF